MGNNRTSLTIFISISNYQQGNKEDHAAKEEDDTADNA